MRLQPWKTKSGNKGRLQVHPEDLLRAIKKAFAENPVEGERSIADVAELLSGKYLAVKVPHLKAVIRGQMTDDQRAEHNIEQPKRYAGTQR